MKALAVTLLGGLASVGLAGEFAGDVPGPVVVPSQLERFDTVGDSSDIDLLGVTSPVRRNGGFEFPEGNPLGAPSGTVRFNRGLPLYYTVAAGARTGLYGWTPNAPNAFRVEDFAQADPGARALRAWGYDAPMCAGVRGNGPRLWAHFTSIARLVEHYGPLGG
ncbi:MAG: hypothetical protein AAFX85_11320, partial [Pseudomonadota bacterium]